MLARRLRARTASNIRAVGAYNGVDGLDAVDGEGAGFFDRRLVVGLAFDRDAGDISVRGDARKERNRQASKNAVQGLYSKYSSTNGVVLQKADGMRARRSCLLE